MKKMERNSWVKLFLGMSVFWLGADLGLAQDDQPSLSKEVIITASKLEEPVSQTGSSVIVITSEEMEKRQYGSVLEAVKRQVGIGSFSNGPFGGGNDIFIRGANAAHTLVMIDGVKIYDAITADANYDLAHLPLDNVERIEIIKGPQSSLYGSDAMGGVINIITKKGEGKPSFFASAEVATKDTYTESLGGRGSAGKLNYSFAMSRQDSDGISKARDGQEEDSYARSSVNSRMNYQATDNLELGLQGMYLSARTEGDDGAFQDDPNRLFEAEQSLVALSAKHDVNDVWNQKLNYSWFRNVRQDSDDADAVDTTEAHRAVFKGWLQEADWQHDVNVGELLSLNDNIEDILLFGFQYDHESGKSSSSRGSNTPRVSTENLGYYVQNKIGLDDKLFWTLAFRADDHSRFGVNTTGRTTVSYLFDTQTRLKGSYGTGFNAPSLFQLFSSFGDSTLNAEKSWSYDVGLEQELFDQKLTLSSVFFLQRFKDLIEFDLGAFKYMNIGSARTSGVESEIKYSPMDNLYLSYGFTYLEARDLQNDVYLRRRPNLKHNINFDFSFWEKFNWNVNVTRNLKTYDPALTRLKDYTVVDMALNYAHNKNVKTFLKIENMFNETYQELRGFSNAPRLFRVGADITY